MLRIAFFGLFSLVSLHAVARPALADDSADQNLRLLISALDKRIDWVDTGSIAFPLFLEKISTLSTPSSSKKDPAGKLRIDCNLEEVLIDPEQQKAFFPAKLMNVRVGTVLGIACEQMGWEGAVPLLRDDHIEIVPQIEAEDELGLKLELGDPMPVLINRFFTKTPLDKALQQIAERHNQNIVISPSAEARAAMPITARLINAPIDAAVESLACMADLRMVRQSNVLYVTTKEQANEIRPVTWPKRTKRRTPWSGPAGPLGGLPRQ